MESVFVMVSKKIEAYAQMDLVMMFLMGLNDSYQHIKSQLLLLDPMPSISRVFPLVVQEEPQRLIGDQQSINVRSREMAFALKNEQVQHSASARGNPRFSKGRPFCTNCNIPGHTLETCYKIHGFPPGYKMRGKINYKHSNVPVNQVSGQHRLSTNEQSSNDQYVSVSQPLQSFDKCQMEQLMNLFIKQLSSSATKEESTTAVDSVVSGICSSVSVFSTLNDSSCWIVDSGASRHICSHANAFLELKPISNSRVILPNHEHVDVRFYGDIRIGSLLLLDVLYIPDFRFNLISVGYLLNTSSFLIHFSRHSFEIQDTTTKKMIGKGNKIEGLFVLQNLLPDTAASVNQIGFQIWHRRLGHPSMPVIKSLESVLPMNFTGSSTTVPCHICHLAKQKRIPFVSSSVKSLHAFDLIHCDIWGPYHVPTYNNQRFFLTLVDDCTRFTWTFLFQHKSDAQAVVSRFYVMIETQFLKKIKAFRTDNAK